MLQRGQVWKVSTNAHHSRKIDNVEEAFDLVEWHPVVYPGRERSSRIKTFEAWIRREQAELDKSV
jgi:hypothetical protein